MSLVGCATARGPQGYKVKKDVYYTLEKRERQSGDFYFPDRDSQSGGPSPVVIAVHGGGFNSGNKSHMAMVAKSLASHGITVYSINYRLAPKFKHPTPFHDLKKAYNFLKKNRKKYKLDMKRVGLWGYSAGGYIVSYFAARTSHSESTDFQKYPLSGVVAGGTPFDLTWYARSPYFYKYLGNYRDRVPKRYEEASIKSYINKDMPEFFLYHSTADDLVEHSQTAAFEFQLKKLKVPVIRYDVTSWNHTATFLMASDANKKGVEFFLNTFRNGAREP